MIDLDLCTLEMGNIDSRSEQQVHTPQQVKGSNPSVLDPRSPSQNVDRTPLKLAASSEDPRSPTKNVLRTPIQIYSVQTKAKGDVRQVLNYENEQCSKASPDKEANKIEKSPLTERNKI